MPEAYCVAPQSSEGFSAFDYWNLHRTLLRFKFEAEVLDRAEDRSPNRIGDPIGR